jgi:hypothetical protein
VSMLEHLVKLSTTKQVGDETWEMFGVEWPGYDDHVGLYLYARSREHAEQLLAKAEQTANRPSEL